MGNGSSVAADTAAPLPENPASVTNAKAAAALKKRKTKKGKWTSHATLAPLSAAEEEQLLQRFVELCTEDGVLTEESMSKSDCTGHPLIMHTARVVGGKSVDPDGFLEIAQWWTRKDVEKRASAMFKVMAAHYCGAPSTTPADTQPPSLDAAAVCALLEDAIVFTRVAAPKGGVEEMAGRIVERFGKDGGITQDALVDGILSMPVAIEALSIDIT